MNTTSFDPDTDLYPTPDYDEVIGTLRRMLDPKEFDRILNIIENDLCLYLLALGDIQSEFINILLPYITCRSEKIKQWHYRQMAGFD